LQAGRGAAEALARLLHSRSRRPHRFQHDAAIGPLSSSLTSVASARSFFRYVKFCLHPDRVRIRSRAALRQPRGCSREPGLDCGPL